MKKFFIITTILSLLLLAGCGTAPVSEESSPAVANDIAAAALLAEASGEFAADIRLSGKDASITGSGAALENGILTICAPGCYRLAGELDGSVVIDCDGDVELVLCGLRLRGESYALFARQCDSLTLTLTAENGQSYFSQTVSAEDNGVCLSSKAPLTVQGSGYLTLQSAGDGLSCSEDFTLANGNLTVNADNCGIRSKGSGKLYMTGGTLSVQSEGKALKGDYICLSGGTGNLISGEQAVDAGEFYLTAGTLTVESAEDGIQAETLLSVSGGELNLHSSRDALQAAAVLSVSGGTLNLRTDEGGGMAYYVYDSGSSGGGMGFGGFGGSSSTTYTLPDYSCKALKSDGSISVSGGTLNINSCDDAIHAAGDVTIDGGTLNICSNDDAIHSDTNLTLNNGQILITDCFEGLEAETVTVNGGEADIYAVNDGINASSAEGGFGWDNPASFVMNDGRVEIFITGASSNLGDGIDSNGSIILNGGYLTSSTDGSSMENGIDSGSSFVVNGGILASGGNSGMQESAAATSLQCTAVLSVNVQADTECVVTDAQGNVLISFTPCRYASCLVFSHPDFTIGETYTVTFGEQSQDFTFSSVSYSDRGGFGGFGGFGGGPGGGPF